MDSTQKSSVQIAGYEIFGLVTDLFRLDGGAMFGSIPKTLWSQRIPADESNRIQLCTRLLVLRSKDRLVLVDAGMGQKWEGKPRAIFAVENLIDLGSSSPDIFGRPLTDVILTHLHFDHAGGISRKFPDGSIGLTFPGARHHLSRENWERAKSPGPRERAAYLPDNVMPLEKAKLEFTGDGAEVIPGVTVNYFFGHTAGLQGVLIGKGPEALWYPADLIPTAHHVPLPYIMGYDLCAETTLNEKTKFLSLAADEGWWIVFEHDVDTAIAQVERDEKGGFRVARLGNLPVWKLGV